MFKYLKNIILVAGLLSAINVKAQSLSLESCYELSKKNYPLIKQYELLDKSLEFTINNANKAYFPQLSLTGIAGYIFGGLPSFSMPGANTEVPSDFKLIGIAQLNQVIWDGGATKNHKEIIKASTEIEKSNLDVNIYLIRERINQLFFGVLIIDEQLKQLHIQAELLNSNLKRVQTFKENGLSYLTDVDELRAEVLKIEQKEIEFRFARQAYISMLAFMIHQPLNESTVLELPLELNISVGEITRPERALFASQKKVLNSQSAMDKVALMPKLGLLGAGVVLSPGINFGPSQFNSIALAGLSLGWNTGGLYKNKNNKELNKISMQKIEILEEQFLFNTKLQLTQTQADAEKKKAILLKDEEIVQLRTTIRNNYQKKYENGMCTLLDVITATEKESEAKAGKALHSIEWLLSTYQYQTSKGN